MGDVDMSEITNIEQAISNAALLLTRKEYQTPDKINEIAQRLMTQVLVMETYKKCYGQVKINTLERVAVAREVGVKEKALRDWLKSDTGIKIEHLISLANYYVRLQENV